MLNAGVALLLVLSVLAQVPVEPTGQPTTPTVTPQVGSGDATSAPTVTPQMRPGDDEQILVDIFVDTPDGWVDLTRNLPVDSFDVPGFRVFVSDSDLVTTFADIDTNDLADWEGFQPGEAVVAVLVEEWAELGGPLPLEMIEPLSREFLPESEIRSATFNSREALVLTTTIEEGSETSEMAGGIANLSIAAVLIDYDGEFALVVAGVGALDELSELEGTVLQTAESIEISEHQ